MHLKTKFLIFLLAICFILNSCREKDSTEFQGPFHSSILVTTTNADEDVMTLEVAYTVAFTNIENQNCLLASNQELNAMVIEPTIRSVIRSVIATLEGTSLSKLESTTMRTKMNAQFNTMNLWVNDQNLNACPFQVVSFYISKATKPIKSTLMPF